MPSHGTPESIAQSCHFLNSCPVKSLLELLPSHVTSESISQSCHFLNSCPVMSLLELLHSHVTPGAHDQSCHFLSTCPGMSLLELSPTHVTPGALAVHVTTGARALSCHSWSSCPVMLLLELSPTNLQVQATYCFRPVVSLLDLLPSHVTPGALADEVTRPCGELLSLSNVIFVHSSSCGFRVPAACLVASETLYARAHCSLL